MNLQVMSKHKITNMPHGNNIIVVNNFNGECTDEVSLSRPHPNVQNGMVVHAKRTAVKNNTLTTVVWYNGSCINTINLRILPYKCFVMQTYLASCANIPY